MAKSSDVVKSFTIKVNTKDGKVKIEGITKGFQGADKAFNKLKNDMAGGLPDIKVPKGFDHLKDATGSAASSVTELGRVFSDAPYGIRGVANNISQLASQFANTTKKAGGLGGALKAMGAAFYGPLGILVAFQAGVALLEMWSMKAKPVNAQLEVMGSSVTETSTKLRLLNTILNDENATLEEQQRVVNSAREELEGYGIEVNTTEEGLQKMGFALSNLQTELERTAIAQGYANILQEQYNDIAKLTVGGIEAQIDWYDHLIGAALGGVGGVNTFNATLMEGAKDLQKEIEKRREKIAKTMTELRKDISGEGEPTKSLADYLWGDDSKKGGSTRKRAMKIFKAGLLDMERLILAQNLEERKIGVENTAQLIKIAQNGKLREIQLKYDTFVEKQQIRLADYKASVKGHEREAMLVGEAEEKYRQTIIDAKTDTKRAQKAINDNFDKKLIADTEKTLQALAMMESQYALGQVNGVMNPTGDDGAEGAYNEALMKEQNDRRMALENELILASASGNVMAKQAAQQQLDEFDINVKQQEIERDLAHNEAKRNIQMEYVGFVGQTGQLLGKLAGDNEKLQKAALIVDKGAKTAQVIVQTQGAIAARRAGNLMLAASGPQGPALAAADEIPMAAAIKRAKIGAALSIANIWAASSKSKSMPSSGSGGGNGGRTFDFNLVGSTGQNQLAQETAGQLNQPVQAYVVSSDITNQQQLDNNIQGQASFGED
jgi:hypothetical protein